MKARLKTFAPLIVAVLLVVATLVFHAVDTPSTSDDAFLSPKNADRFAGSELQRRLTADGRRVVRHTTARAALNDAMDGNATLFVPAPEYLEPDFYRLMAFLPSSTRVVFVQPGQGVLDAVAAETVEGKPRLVGERWATEVVGPGGCDLGGAGRAAVGRSRYVLDGARSCYDGHVLITGNLGGDLVIVGAPDPFTDERIGEYDNARLAVGLLSRYPKIVWLDLHSLAEPSRSPDPTIPPEPPGPQLCGTPGVPGVVCVTLPPGSPGPTGRCTVPPTRSGTPQPTYTCYIVGPDTRGGGGGGGGKSTPRPESSQQPEAGEPPNPLWAAFPPWFWAALVGLAVAGLLLVLARARRLGPPVAERLPVVVRSTETITGRGRLYARAHARGPALNAVRAQARLRLVPALGLPAGARSGEIVDAVAARTGLAGDAVHDLLYGAVPESDAELTTLADAIDQLVEDTTRETRSD